MRDFAAAAHINNKSVKICQPVIKSQENSDWNRNYYHSEQKLGFLCKKQNIYIALTSLESVI